MIVKNNMHFENFCKVLDEQQRLLAKRSPYSVDKAKTSLSMPEKLNRYAQEGNVLRYKQITFTWVDGFGLLTIGKHKIYGATFSDMVNAIKKHYGQTPIWAIQ